MADAFEEATARLAEAVFPYESEGGYAGLTLAREEGAAFLYWRGDPADPVRQVIGALAAEGWEVVVKPAAHDRATLRQARDRLMRAPGAQRSGITTAAIPEDGSALEVGSSSPVAAEEFVARLALGVPVRVRSDPGPTVA